MMAAFATGWLAFSYSTAPARASLVVHASAGVAILLLAPWKSAIGRRGLARRRPGWWASLAFSALVLVSIAAGILHSTGILVAAGALTAMEVHVGAAIVAIPFFAWHVYARRSLLRLPDLSRRRLLQMGMLAGSAGLTYAAGEIATRLGRLPGGDRRFTGSYELASFQPDLMPVTQWMFDPVPAIDAATWRLTLTLPARTHRLTYSDLAVHDHRLTALLDCTGGFCSRQEWAGVWLSELVAGGAGHARSIRVKSVTGYDRRFPVEELPRLLLATRIGGNPLSPGQGYPARLVAPDRRGYWWVKWVDTIEVDELPYWWQLPFPMQ